MKWHTKRYAPAQSTPPKKYPFHWKQTRGALPFVGGYQVPSIDSIFHADLTPNTPFFHFRIKFNTNWKYLGKFWEIYKFCSNFNIKFANLGLKITFLHTKWPPFLGIHIKKVFFFFFFLSSHRMTSSLNKILYWKPPTFVLWSALIPCMSL